MSDLAAVLLIGLVLYAMKALPFNLAPVPRTPRVERAFDLLPVALLMAMLLPPALRPLAEGVDPGRLAALAAVALTFAICRLSDRQALAIGCGLGVLALAEWL